VRPIELLDSFDEVLTARQDLVAAITRLDVAQFRLFVAVGRSPVSGSEVSVLVPVLASDAAATQTPGVQQPSPSTPLINKP
jgi:hypothetical protein